MNRHQLVRMAQRTVDGIPWPKGFRVVVVVTDASGDYVGVGSNTNSDDVDRILLYALAGADRTDLDVTVAPDRNGGPCR